MKRKNTLLSLLMAGLLMIQSGLPVFAGQTLKDKVNSSGSGQTITAESNTAADADSYSVLLAQYAAAGYESAAAERLELPVTGAVGSSELALVAGIGGLDGQVLDWTAAVPEWVEFSFTVSVAGLYQLGALYYIPEGTNEKAVRSFTVDGKLPFAEATTLHFQQMYTDSTESPRINSRGDEVSPSQKELPAWRELLFCDSQGLYSQPYVFYFEPGEHVVRLQYVNVGLYLSALVVEPAQQLPTYAQVAADYAARGYKNATKPVTVEAERDIAYKSSSVIRMQNTTNPTVSPRNDDAKVMNILKGEYWKTGNEEITWVIDVPETGLYTLNMHVQQSLMEGLPVYRTIAIDGEVPFEEMLQYTFAYSRSWVTETVSDENGKPYLFYLTAGTHELTMTVKMSNNCALIQGIKEDMDVISALLTDIKRVTGEDPDLNYEYHLDEKIPTLLQSLREVYNRLNTRYQTIMEISSKSSPAANQFASILDDFGTVYEEPDLIPRKLDTLNDDLETLGGWYSEFQSQPLAMDTVTLGSPDIPVKTPKATFWDYFIITFKAFLRSFSEDYSDMGSLSATGDADITLDVWIGRGKEWAQLLDEQAGDAFTAETGIALRINVIPSGQLSTGGLNTLMLAMAADREPDVALGVSYELPVEFSFRNASLELSGFTGYGEVSGRFLPGVLLPFTDGGACYGLPETMNFRVLLYRTDIIRELGLAVPNTWEDIYSNVLPILYQNNLEFYFPSDYTGFSVFLYQHGGDYYTADGQYSALDSAEAYAAFKEWTDLFTRQGIDVSASFYNRFRSGSMPMGVASYLEYIQLLYAAPELMGRIGMAALPGHVNAEGEIDRSAGGYADTGCMAFADTQNPEACFAFLDWWTSDSVQIAYGKSLEAIVGTASRWGSANLNAFLTMSWTEAEKAVIREGFRWAKERPVIFGGYYTTRHITNAWNRTVLSAYNTRDSLEDAVADINTELRMRREEAGSSK